jgi:hypothetical protein
VSREIQRTLITPTSLHHLRYVRYKSLGLSIEDIAKEDKVDPSAIQRSITQVETYYAMNTMEDLRSSEIEVMLFNKELKKLAISSALQAEIRTYDATGTKLVHKDPDHLTRLKAVDALIEIGKNLISAEARINQGPTNPTNVQVNVASGGTVGVATFEDRLREVRKKRIDQQEQKTLPASSEPAVVVDAEVEEFRPNWEGPIEQGTA